MEKASYIMKRRWFRFSLRSLLILVTLLAVATGWTIQSLHWIEKRRAALRGSAVNSCQGERPLFTKPIAPGGLWIFGERGQSAQLVNISKLAESEIAEVRRLYPESKLMLRFGIFRGKEEVDLAPGEYPE